MFLLFPHGGHTTDRAVADRGEPRVKEKAEPREVSNGMSERPMECLWRMAGKEKWSGERI